MKRIIKPISIMTILCLIVVFAIPVSSTEAFGMTKSSVKTIKAGVLEFDQYCYKDKNGNYRGFDVEYAEKIGQYMNCRIKIVPFDSINKANSALKAGRIQMLVDFIKTDERKAEFTFTGNSLINISNSVYVRNNYDKIEYNNWSDLNNKRIGVVKDSAVRLLFKERCEAHDIQPVFVEFDNTSQIDKALEKGKIDGAATETITPAGFKPVLHFAPIDSYMMVKKGNTVLKNEIDGAVDNLITDNPDYARNLYNKYFKASSGSGVALSNNEKAYVKSHPAAKVAIISSAAPFSYYKKGRAKGIMPSYYKILGKKIGINFKMVKYDSYKDALNAVRTGKADVLGYYFGDIVLSSDEGLAITDPYESLNCVMVTQKGNEKAAVKSAAVTTRTKDILEVLLAENHDNIKLKSYGSINDCYSALDNGKAGSIICTVPAATWLVNQHGNNRISMSAMTGINIDLCGAMSEDKSMLRTIINKGAAASGEDISRIIIQTTAERDGNLQTLIETMPAKWMILFLSVLIALILWLTIAMLSLRRRQRENEALEKERAAARQREMQVAADKSANEEKNRFFSTIGHDMRTPLNAIIGYSTLAQDKNTSEDVKDDLKKICTSGKLLLELINDTLVISRLNSGKTELKMSNVNIDEVIEEVMVPVREFARAKDIELKVSNEAGNSTLLMDRLNIQKILLNLLTNAIKYTAEGGHVKLTVTDSISENIYSDTRFVIEDDGIGIDPEFMKKLFEPFAQADSDGKAGGTGLGLSIVKRLVDIMGGKIRCDSTKGKGTKFTVYLRFRIADDAVAGERNEQEHVSFEDLRGKKILLCEDNNINRDLACELLQRQGMEVTAAVNGKLAVEAFKASRIGEFAAILMDIRMPVMDGYEASKTIHSLDREDAPDIPIIPLTAEAFDDDMEKCREAGMTGYLSKPMDAEKLYEAIAKAIKR